MSRIKVIPMEMEMEPLSNQEGERPQIPQIRPVGFFENTHQLVVAYASYYQHITAVILVTLAILAVIIVLQFIAVISTKTHVALTSITHDYTDIKYYSEFDLAMKDVDHWCLLGGNDDCTCDDPTVPLPAYTHQNWTKAWKKNRQIVSKDYGNVDVVFLGDQAIEAWNGRFLGKQSNSLKKVSKEFENKFNNTNATEVLGIALGIAGDTIANLYWRLVHGEMPDKLDPSVWWITIGGNDLAVGHCSEEIVVLGILRIAEFILDRRPGATVVINSILPSHVQVRATKKHRIKPFYLWSSIQVVNDQLKKFCENKFKFNYFDSGEIFFRKKPKSVAELKKEMKEKGKVDLSSDLPQLKPNLMSPFGTVLPQGHKVWMAAIIPELQRILEELLFSSLSEQIYEEDDLYDDAFKNDREQI